MIDNCDMNLFDPENMEVKPGNIDLFIPVGSKVTVSASVDSVYCIGLRTSDRDVNLKMSREQVVKLARGILTLSGEERPQGDLISREALKEHKFVGNKFVQFGGRTNGKTLENINKAYQQGWNDAIDAIIDNAPTVNPEMPIFSEVWYQERPQGEWIKAQGEWVTDTAYKICFKCSECKTHFEFPFNFCPNCGAQMVKGGAE